MPTVGDYIDSAARIINTGKVVFFFFPVLFLGRAPVMNSLRHFEPWRTAGINAGEGTVEKIPGNTPVYTWTTSEGFADDLNRQFIPWGLYTQERIKSGELPLWNPPTVLIPAPSWSRSFTGVALSRLVPEYFGEHFGIGAASPCGCPDTGA